MIKTMIELKSQYHNDIDSIMDYYDLKSLAVNFIRAVTSKTIAEMPILEENCVEVIPLIIRDIKKYGYKTFLKAFKKGDIHKAYSRKYVYDWYGLDYWDAKHTKKEEKKVSL